MENNKPKVVNVEPGTYYWCTCGQSKNFPHCDGSHLGGSATPHMDIISEKSIVAICACGKSGKGIYCDGSHTKLNK